MSEQTKNARRRIYDFLEGCGVDLVPIRGTLRKLIMAYGVEKSLELQGEVLVLRDKARRHREIIRSCTENHHGIKRQNA